jgi:hypothetical protein
MLTIKETKPRIEIRTKNNEELAGKRTEEI